VEFSHCTPRRVFERTENRDYIIVRRSRNENKTNMSVKWIENAWRRVKCIPIAYLRVAPYALE